MNMIPDTLRGALRPITVIVGHYGAGKTNFCMNLAIDVAREGRRVSLVDLDVVNPYFRASEQRRVLEKAGVGLVAPVFAEAGTSLDVPSLTGAVVPTLQGADAGHLVIVDAGGDDAGATALGRFAQIIAAADYAMFYVANKFRNLVAEPADALENMREIEAASHLACTAIACNAHMQELTTLADIEEGAAHADELSRIAALPVVCTTVPENFGVHGIGKSYPVHRYVRSPWE